jgi:hypothetical protein
VLGAAGRGCGVGGDGLCRPESGAGEEQESAASARPLAPIAGIRGLSVLQMSQAEYLSLVDYTGRQIRADKRGAIEGNPPAVLVRLGYRPETWTRQVLAVKSDYSRAMGEVESLIEKAAASRVGVSSSPFHFLALAFPRPSTSIRISNASQLLLIAARIHCCRRLA